MRAAKDWACESSNSASFTGQCARVCCEPLLRDFPGERRACRACASALGALAEAERRGREGRGGETERDGRVSTVLMVDFSLCGVFRGFAEHPYLAGRINATAERHDMVSVFELGEANQFAPPAPRRRR